MERPPAVPRQGRTSATVVASVRRSWPLTPVWKLRGDERGVAAVRAGDGVGREDVPVLALNFEQRPDVPTACPAIGANRFVFGVGAAPLRHQVIDDSLDVLQLVA